MKLVYRLTVNTPTYIISGLALPGLGVVPAWFSPGLQFYRGNIWSLEGVGYTSPHLQWQHFFKLVCLTIFSITKPPP